MADDDFTGFAAPPFDAARAVEQIKRALRDAKLAERAGDRFELRGRRVVELAVGDGVVTARLARRAALTPEWDTLVLRSAADQRKFVDTVKQRLAKWNDDD